MATAGRIGNWKRTELQWGRWLHSQKVNPPAQLRNPSQGVAYEDLGTPEDWWTGEHKESHACPAWLRDAILQMRDNGQRVPDKVPFGMVSLQQGQGTKCVRLLFVELDFNVDQPEVALRALLAAKQELEATCP